MLAGSFKRVKLEFTTVNHYSAALIILAIKHQPLTNVKIYGPTICFSNSKPDEDV